MSLRSSFRRLHRFVFGGVTSGSARQPSCRQIGRRLRFEVLEDRTMPSASLPFAVGAIGDSTTAERGGNNWTEQLAALRGIDFGTSAPTTLGGVAFLDYADILSGSPQTMAANGSLATLTASVAAGDVRLVYLGGAGGDFAQQYAAIYQGTLAGAGLSSFISAEVAGIRNAMDTLTAAGPVNIVLENVADFGGTPFVVQNVGNFLGLQSGQTPDPVRKQLFTDAIGVANAQIQALADARHVPVVDAFAMGKTLADAAHPPAIGGYALDVTPTFAQVTSLAVSDPLHFFIDSQHPGPVAQGLKANAFLLAIHQAYGFDVAPLTDQQILTYAYGRAGQAPPALTGTSFFDISAFVNLERPPTATSFAVSAVASATTIAVPAHASDPNGDRLTVTAVSQPKYGTVVIKPDGSVVYTLTRYALAADTFTYTVSDGRGGTSTATITVNIQAPPAVGIALLKAQIDALAIPRVPKQILAAQIAVAETLLKANRLPSATLSLKAFEVTVKLFAKLGLLSSTSAQLFLSEADALMIWRIGMMR